MGLRAGRTHACSNKTKCECPFLTAGLVAVSFLVLLGLSALHFPEPFEIEPESSSSSSSAVPAATTPPEVTLLVWTHPFDRKQQLPDCRERYAVNGCVLTDDRRSYPDADGVLVHHRDVVSGNGTLGTLPPEAGRPPGQKWIWLNYESPSHTPELWRLEGLFNLTMSYRTDSDIFLPYGYLVNKNGDEKLLTKPFRASRSGFVAWVVSNWVESQARVAFYYELSQYIQVDVFGQAGQNLPRGAEKVVELLTSYCFYLALENSQHTDYITEKLWNAVSAGAVPVVLGPSRKNYERFLPAEAFIHVDDFPSVKELAHYLLRLRRDPIRLMWHLRWRTDFGLRQPGFWSEHYCTACKVLRKTVGQTHVVHDLTQWFDS